jgi:hypothetical protein
MIQEPPIKEQMLKRIRATGKSEETFKTYWYWCDKFVQFVKAQTGTWKHPRECGLPSIRPYEGPCNDDVSGYLEVLFDSSFLWCIL